MGQQGSQLLRRGGITMERSEVKWTNVKEISALDRRLTGENGVLIEATGMVDGYECEVVITPHGSRNGYVRVPPEHPWCGLHYDDEALYTVDCHGGLTFADGRRNGGWWLGFDCSHLGDAHDPDLMDEENRAHGIKWNHEGDVVRSLEYVQGECEGIARAVRNAAVNHNVD